jgi:antitoxin component YwqK of YwqJK toxin-antitoxin module
MKAKLTILFSIGVFFMHGLVAQTTTETIYLDGLMKSTSQDKSAFKLELNKIGGDVYDGKIFDFTGEIKAIGRYIKVNKRVLEDGHFVFYFANGQIESEGEFDRGVKVGNWKRYDPAGKRKSDRYYPVESANKIREAMELEKSEDD